jgi:hypothetical protein
MRRCLSLSTFLAAALGVVGCQDQRTEPTAPAPGAAELRQQSKASGRASLHETKFRLPPSVRVSHPHRLDLSRRVIDPGDYVCPPSTPVIDWFIGEVDEFVTKEPAIFDFIFNDVWADLIPQWEALFLLTDETPQEFGYNGEYTHVLQKTHRDAMRFWDIRSDDIQLLAMKGTMLVDTDRVATTYELPFIPPFFGLSPDDAATVASLVRDAILASEVVDGGNHPLFSFNAFAFSDGDDPLPDKIVMGDGILAGYAAVGFADVAPQAVYAHEFGHHIQFENNYFEEDEVPGDTQAEFTRYFELMSDAYSAYYLPHKRGAAMNRKRVEQFLEVFFQIGDCAFDNPGHHGTPNQRMAAAQFGFDVADQAQKQGHILTSDQFHDLFVAAYPDLVAPDAV